MVQRFWIIAVASILFAGSEYLSVENLTPQERAELAKVAPSAAISQQEQGTNAQQVPAASSRDLSIAMEALDRGDFKTAFAHFKIAAEQGDPIAQQNLAVMYNNGYGTEKNTKMAAYWMEKSTRSAKVAIK